MTVNGPIDAPRPAPATPGVLVVDDTPANLTLLCGILKERGYRARPVPSGELALQAAAAEPPDLVLLDIGMPGMDGYEVCARLKSDPRLTDTPVIFLTAHTDTANKVRAFAVGGVDYVTKPFQAEEVLARVATHLELRRQARALQESYDRLSQVEKLRDTLAHMIVHDLRSPLSAMYAYLGILRIKLDISAPDLAEGVGKCLETARRMDAMIASVLDVSKLEAAALEPQRERCDLAAIVREVLGEMRWLLADREVTVAAPRPVPLLADRGLVARVVQNLLSNAVKHTGGGGELRVSVAARDGEARFELGDDGPGVPAASRQRIFEKFGGVDPPPAGERRGTGLGLAFCKLAVEAHGGRIGVESVDGARGSTFWFALPARASGQDVDAPLTEASARADRPPPPRPGPPSPSGGCPPP